MLCVQICWDSGFDYFGYNHTIITPLFILVMLEGPFSLQVSLKSERPVAQTYPITLLEVIRDAFRKSWDLPLAFA